MIYLALLATCSFLAYCYGVYEERKNSKRLFDLYFNTIAKKERDFRERDRRNREK
jgi:hypothetical protein